MHKALLITIFSLILSLTYAEESCPNSIYGDQYWITGEREEIPSWVFESQGSGRYVGVSDPCLDSINGANQALMRGWFLSMAAGSIDVNILQENYEEKKQVAMTDVVSSRFTQFVRFSVKVSDKSFKVGRTFTSLFGEQFIEMIEVNDSISLEEEGIYQFTTAPVASISGEYVLFGSEKSVVSGRVRSELSIEAICNGKPLSTKFIMEGTRENRKLFRYINSLPIDNSESGRFWYNEDESKSYMADDLSLYGYSLKDGFWSSFFESFIFHLVNEENYAYVIKNLHDSYGTTQYEIVRSIYKGNTALSLYDNVIVEDKLISQWNIIIK